MTSANMLFKTIIKSELKWRLPKRAHKFFDAALSGDPDAAHSLVCNAHSDQGGMVAMALYNYLIPREAFRQALEAAWQLDNSGLIAAAGNRRRLYAMFRYASYSIPKKFPETLWVWRGTSGLSILRHARDSRGL